MLWSRWNQRVAKQSLSSASFGGAIIERRSFVMTIKPELHIRHQSSMLPPTSGLLESVSKYMFGPSSAENDDDKKDARELMDELLDSNIAVGEMNSSHLKSTKRAFALLVDMEQTTMVMVLLLPNKVLAWVVDMAIKTKDTIKAKGEECTVIKVLRGVTTKVRLFLVGMTVMEVVPIDTVALLCKVDTDRTTKEVMETIWSTIKVVDTIQVLPTSHQGATQSHPSLE